MSKRILIIKHGALGDWIIATGAYKCIRHAYPDAKITLLTQSHYVELARQTGWFDAIIVDNRKGFLRSIALLIRLRRQNFTHVFDLQRSQRTLLYYQILKSPKRYWSGRITGCAGYFVDAPNAHILMRIAIQLRAAGIDTFPVPDVNWLRADVSQIKPIGRYALIIPGCAAHRVGKKWTTQGYVDVIAYLYKKGIKAILVGGEKDRGVIDEILQGNQNRYELKHVIISLPLLAELARHATICLGVDTGPTHLVAAIHIPCLVLLCSTEGTIQLNLPYGRHVKAIEIENLQNLSSAQVIVALDDLISQSKSNEILYDAL